jgi:hypothetical protein
MYATQTEEAPHTGVKMRGVVYLKCAVRTPQPFPMPEPVMGCDLEINVWKEEIFEILYTKGERSQTANDMLIRGLRMIKKTHGSKNVIVLSYWEKWDGAQHSAIHVFN